MGSILNDLKIQPSPKSRDYVENKTQFHLYSLLTEQRHPKTMTLSASIRDNIRDGLNMLFSVDEDVSGMINGLAGRPDILEQAVEAVCRAVKGGRKICFYGCGATGRLAKQMESAFWRPFWERVKVSPAWDTLSGNLPEGISDLLIGEMTGADRALISSLEGFEDLELIGKLQLADRGIRRGDVVFCVTEGGETSSVIGAILAALGQYGEGNPEDIAEAAKNLYFVYNNPDNLLLPFDRSWRVLENQGITKLNLTTGPQAISGSTRMQATTAGTFILGVILEEAVGRILQEYLSPGEMQELGFTSATSIEQRLRSFDGIRSAVAETALSLSRLTELEAQIYRNRHFTTYFAKMALTTVFIDSTERSPTFRLFPLDTSDRKIRRSWLQVWTEAENGMKAWQALLGRSYRGLDPSFYEEAFTRDISDPYLREAALRSLASAGNDQQLLYDLSFSDFNRNNRGPAPGDLGVILCMDGEFGELKDPGSPFRQFCDLFLQSGATLAIVNVDEDPGTALDDGLKSTLVVNLPVAAGPDPFGLRKQIALKMLLNAHSTGVMVLLGRAIGNTMISVNPGNLKLIGRATHLIMLHVNDMLSSWDYNSGNGRSELPTFAEINAVLFDAMEWLEKQPPGQTPEVALSIIRILEAIRTGTYVSWEEARDILDQTGLEDYLRVQRLNR